MQNYLIKIPPDNTRTASAFEEVLNQLHQTLIGRQIIFEILGTGQNIGFYLSGEPAACEVAIGQIYAMAPAAEIHPVADHAAHIESSSSIHGFELGLARDSIFPLKTYTEFDGDSLSAVLSVLSQCTADQSVWIQYVLRPKKDSGLHHFVIRIRRRLEKIGRLARVKYWFKKGVTKSFDDVIEKKINERLFAVDIRLAVLSKSAQERNTDSRAQAVFGAFSSFNTLDFNQLKIRQRLKGQASMKRFSERAFGAPFLLSASELATLFHLPSEKEVPNIIHVLAKKEAPPKELPTDSSDAAISFFGTTNFRGQSVPFGIRRSDRRRHFHLLGKSGSGKSKLLELLVKNDLVRGHGVAVLDPHGDLVDSILRLVPEERVKDVIVFDPSDLEYPISFNPLEGVSEKQKMRVALGFIEIFKKLFGTNWTPRIEHLLRYTTIALLDSPNTSVLSILKMLTDKRYRQYIVSNIKDKVVKNFWVNEFQSWSQSYDNEAITPLLNKVGQFLATDMIRNIVGQPTNRLDFREIMDKKKILLMKVSKGILGEENASLLGAIAVTKIYQAAMSRADIPEDQRVDFYFYVDEFHNFATESFDEILSEARKYRLNLTIANQFLGQLNDQIRKTVFGNVGSLLSFRVGGEDAAILAKEFSPRFSERDIVNLGVRDFCVKMSIDGEVREAFSGRTLDMMLPEQHSAQACIEHSRKTCARPLVEVLETIKRWEEAPGENPATNQASDGNPEFEEPLV